LKAELLGS